MFLHVLDGCQEHTLYAGEYAMEGEDHPVVGWFWELVESMTEAKRAKLLQVKRVLDEFQQCVVYNIWCKRS
jgi:hypothetical protein